MNNYAIFVSASRNYLKSLNALLNSIDKRNISCDVYLLHWEFETEYINECKEKLGFNLIPIEILEKDFPQISGIGEPGKNLFIKQARFKYISEYGKIYDAICMLDADMFITSDSFCNFFDLVKGTNKLIGCEERCKWEFNERYRIDNKPIFTKSVKAYKFHCSVPIFFDYKQWADVFYDYNKMAFLGWETKPDGKVKRIGDMYSWNISIYKNHRQNDCVLFPMHSMTQVHGTAGAFWCAVQKDGDYWYTFDGCEVYTVHGRVFNESFYESQKNWYMNGVKNYGVKYEGKIEAFCNKAFDVIGKEWYDLSFNHKVDLGKYCEYEPFWDKWKR